MIYAFRKAIIDDLDGIMSVIDDARASLKNLEIDQWQDGYPARGDLEKDILENHCYVIVDEHQQVIAVGALIAGAEPTYAQIDGAWKSEKDYLTIHRIAVKTGHGGKGLGNEMVRRFKQLAIEEGVGSIRTDTHMDNIPMQRMLEKSGFAYCGVVTIADGALRNAYECVIV